MKNRLGAAALCAALLTACRTGAPAPAKPAEAAPLGIDPSIVDRGVSPCDDFYAYACGGWIAKTEIPADKPSWSRGFFELRERNLKELRAIADDEAAGRAAPEDRFADKVGAYYASCMDEPAVEAHGLAELKAEWARLGAVKDPESLLRELARLHRAGVFAAFQLGSQQDARDASQVIAVVSQGGLGLPDRDYYLSTDPRSQEILKQYRAHVARMFALAGRAPTEAEKAAGEVLALETALAGSHYTRTELRDPKRVYNRVDLPGLEKLAPQVDWRRYLAGVGHPGVTAINVTTPRNVEEVGRLVKQASPARWRTYLEWNLLAKATGYRALPKAFVDERFAFSSAAFTGAKELEARWKRCVSLTDGALGEALGEAYVRRHFGPEGKAATTRLVSEIEQSMGQDLAGLAWMDPPTRAQANAKLGKVFNKVGYPDKWRDYARLEVRRGRWLDNALAAEAFEVNRELDKVGKPLDRGEWYMSPPTVNAYYEPALNEMVFPAGILRPPFFTLGAPAAVNYGAIGVVVGHELTHGFDDEGRRYDAEGNLRDWWSPTVDKEFDRRAECVAKQYEAYEPLPGVHLNGHLTLGENIADLGGAKLSYAAHRRALGQRGDAPDASGFTPDQQFFLGFAQSWCQKSRDPYVRMLVTVDPHSPPRFRVNGPLSNLPEFQKAWSCPAGAKMVRAERCEVW
ncbi:M13 family metallopeptidase [Anaeromyxobacter paludicola]|uniref:Metallopeptidase n=1 Tax=Anaeromyxobacter paludicola TaxID=2918171 RepID=A0ABN6N164_9BACT|nr:M13 family metallopeptidase [Anaeromyxobacter paludicola]BDG06947.1 metallopeptidase [Anaeromyxobacter paludicola]